MKKTKCAVCSCDVSNNNIAKHQKSCTGVSVVYQKQTCCVFCNKTWEDLKVSTIKNGPANHTRWCEQNPQASVHRISLADMAKSREVSSDEREKRSEKVKLAWASGSYTHVDFGKSFRGRKHSDYTKEVLRQKALQSNHRRLRKGMIEYKGVWLDSSWEYELAKRLDSIGVVWMRPDPIKWIDNDGNAHNYFPDFYLPKYDVYLDPKNPAAFENQKHKINILMSTYTNLVFLKTLNECKTFNI